MPRRLLVLAAGLAVAACAPRLDPGASGPLAQPTATVLALAADSLASADRVGAARRALARVGATPLADGGAGRGRFEWPGAAMVGAFVPGRDPLARSELVVVAAPLDGPAAPAVIAAVRALVERSQWTTSPERTVEVALWRGGADAMPDVLGSPLWARDAVRAVLVVGAEAPSLDRVAVDVVPVGEGGLDLAQRVFDRTLVLAARPSPSDTLATR